LCVFDFDLLFSLVLLASIGQDLAKTIVQPAKEVARRSTIRGFKEDFYHVDADVVVLSGETHNNRKPVSMPPHSLMAGIDSSFHSEGGYAIHGGFCALQVRNHGRA